MKIAKLSLYLIVSLFVVFCTLGWSSHFTKPGVGLFNHKLKSCPSKPNCVVSEYIGKNYIKPIALSIGDSSKQKFLPQDLHILSAEIIKMGGVVQRVDSNYMHAIFNTRIFRFIDDVEFRLDTVLHLRSISRVGYLDFGVNRNRMEKLRMFLKIQFGE